MRHFIAYHNTERMGTSLQEGDPFSVVTNKPVQHLLHNTIWLVAGEGSSPRRYALGSAFVVSEVGETGEEEFKRYARGQGHLFQPRVALNDLGWFPEFFKGLAHFSVGVQEVKDVRFIAELLGLASQAGYHPA